MATTMTQPLPVVTDAPQLRVVSADQPPRTKASLHDDQPSMSGGQSESDIVTPSAELLAELARDSERLESATPQEILRYAVDRFSPRFTMATAFGPEGMTLIHMLREIAPSTPIFNLDTGYQFPETLELRERIKSRYGIEVEMKRPSLTVEQYEAANGGQFTTSTPTAAALSVSCRSCMMRPKAWMRGRALYAATRVRIAPGCDCGLGQEIWFGESQSAGELDQKGSLEADHGSRHPLQPAA